MSKRKRMRKPAGKMGQWSSPGSGPPLRRRSVNKWKDVRQKGEKVTHPTKKKLAG